MVIRKSVDSAVLVLCLKIINGLFLFPGQIARLTKDLENSEKKMRETRNSMAQQGSKKEAEYQQIITNLNRTTNENITKLKEEKVRLFIYSSRCRWCGRLGGVPFKERQD